MYQEIKQMAARALTRLNNVLCRGILDKVTTGKVPTAKRQLLADETYDAIEFAQDWGFISSPPDDGTTELIVAFLRGQRDQGTVLKSFNRTFSLKNGSNIDLLPGETALYNKVSGNYFIFKADGSILLQHHTGTYFKINDDNSMLLQHHVSGSFIKMNTDGTITLSSTSQSITIDSPQVTLTGNLTVDGDVLDNATGAHVNAHTVRDMRTIFNAHVHSGVAAGGANSAAPTTTQ